jgi:hypothetical protein
MIKFSLGLLTTFAGVGAIEGTLGFLVGTLISLTGIFLMFWAIRTMYE